MLFDEFVSEYQGKHLVLKLLTCQYLFYRWRSASTQEHKNPSKIFIVSMKDVEVGLVSVSPRSPWFHTWTSALLGFSS